ncbi:DGPF domain superfamily protein [Salinisphaera sp. PC39]|uniref:YciI family protein n=1 Tax=Salinisphaera sp. PC39 TaxID=1304156 RepID=UPI003340B0C4
MKYLCLAYERESDLAGLSHNEWDALRRETLDYVEALRASGHLVDTHALKSATTATTLRVRGGELSATDGPFAETKEQLGGYFLIEAADFEEAVRIASRWPSARIGGIEVRPVEETLPEDGRY